MPLLGYSRKALREAKENGYEGGKQHFMDNFRLAFDRLPGKCLAEIDLSTPETMAEGFGQIFEDRRRARAELSIEQIRAKQLSTMIQRLEKHLDWIQSDQYGTSLVSLWNENDALREELEACQEEAREARMAYERQIHKLQEDLSECDILVVLDEVKRLRQRVRE